MIPRALSIALFLFGGWLLSGELMAAFFDFAPGIADSAMIIAICAIFCGVPLLFGALMSPGRGWQELGITILVAVGLALFGGLTMILVFNDPGAKPFLPPMPDVHFAPIVGAANLLIVTAAGWLLSRRSGDAAEVTGR